MGAKKIQKYVTLEPISIHVAVALQHSSGIATSNTTPTHSHYAALLNVLRASLMLFMLRARLAYSVIQHRSQGPALLFFFLAPLYNVSNFIDRWLENIFFSSLFASLEHNCKTRSREKKPKRCLKYDSSVYLTEFCVLVRSEYSARSAAVRAFVP